MRALTALFFLSSVLIAHQQVFADDSSSASGAASSQQYDGDSYEAQHHQERPARGPSKARYQNPEPKAFDLCPDPQPADSVKNVYVAHGTFNWQDKAAAYKEAVSIKAQQQQQQKQQQKQQQDGKAQVMSDPAAQQSTGITGATGAWPTAAVKAAFKLDRRPTRDHRTTAAVNDAKTLFPSKLKELDGFLGTFDPDRSPSYEGLAVGPHPHDPDMVFMLHAINGVAEMFLTEKDGTASDLNRPTKIDLAQLMEAAGFDKHPSDPEQQPVDLEIGAVTAFYDPKAKRYAIVWSTSSLTPDVTPPVFMAVSQNRNPLGDWTVWALDLRPSLAKGLDFCNNRPANDYVFEFPQVSFSIDGIFIGGSSSCPSDGNHPRLALAALYVLPKDALYAEPPTDTETPAEILAAVYITRNSWYRSVTTHELNLVPDAFEPFNSIPNPARPQQMEDMHNNPLFVMKVDNAHLSVATLTDEPLDKMNSIDSAPKILAVVVGKGDDYATADGYSDGKAVMPQPNTTTVLQLDYIGMPEAFNGVVFWATHHKGLLYVATGEYWGYDYVRMPSIYWAIIKSTDNLCDLTRKDHGLIASQDGLALSYPVIAARDNGGALVAFSYSGKGGIAGGRYPAYPGVATALVGHDREGKSEGRTVIHIVKKGTTSLNFEDEETDIAPWGIGSAAQVCTDQIWMAVPIPAEVPNSKDLPAWYGSWITWQQL